MENGLKAKNNFWALSIIPILAITVHWAVYLIMQQSPNEATALLIVWLTIPVQCVGRFQSLSSIFWDRLGEMLSVNCLLYIAAYFACYAICRGIVGLNKNKKE